MIKNIGFAILLNCIAQFTWCQHCPWDGSSMIMLDIKSGPTVKIQKIYLLDSAGTVVINHHYFSDKVETDSCIFWKNPSKATKNQSSWRKGYYFPFAKDYRVLELGGHDQPTPYRVQVLYIQGHRMHRSEFILAKEDIQQLCTLNKELWGGMKKPLAIVL